MRDKGYWCGDGWGFDAPGGEPPPRGRPRGFTIKKNKLMAVPELVLRCFLVHLEKIPDEIILQFLELMLENRFVYPMERELQLPLVPGFLTVIEQPLRTIPGLADVANFPRTGIVQEI